MSSYAFPIDFKYPFRENSASEQRRWTIWTQVISIQFPFIFTYCGAAPGRNSMRSLQATYGSLHTKICKYDVLDEKYQHSGKHRISATRLNARARPRWWEMTDMWCERVLRLFVFWRVLVRRLALSSSSVMQWQIIFERFSEDQVQTEQECWQTC